MAGLPPRTNIDNLNLKLDILKCRKIFVYTVGNVKDLITTILSTRPGAQTQTHGVLVAGKAL